MHATVCLLRAGQQNSIGVAVKSGKFIGQFSWVNGDPIGRKGLGQKKKYVVFPVNRPTPIFGPDPKVFIQIFLFLIKSCIILFVCQTRLGSLGVLYELHPEGHPEHFKPIVADRLPIRVLRSSDKHFLNQPPVKTEIAKRAFSQAAPSIWNSLPLSCRTANTFSIFKKLLKTHIFKLAYPD